MDESLSAIAIEEVFKLEIFQEYLKVFKKCVLDYFGEDVLSDCLDGCKELSIVVLRKFIAGKSTLINAVLGEKCLEMSLLPKFRMIQLVRYGESSDSNITINYRNGDVETFSQQDYAEKFQCEDVDEWYSAYKKSSFQEVSYVGLHSASDMISRNIAFVDTPGLKIDDFRFLVVDEVLPTANAVVFVLSAVSLFSSAERKYIARNFAGKEMHNVFFVINRVDQLPENCFNDTVIPCVRNGLRDVFTDQCGVFDEELYKKRVFFTNAYGALCVRTGEPCEIILGKRKFAVPIDLDDIGIPAFEEALLAFIDEQPRERCKLTMRLMARTYQRLYEKTLEELKKDRCNSANYYEHNGGNNTDPRMGALQAMREYIGYCFGDLYGHQPTDLELTKPNGINLSYLD